MHAKEYIDENPIKTLCGFRRVSQLRVIITVYPDHALSDLKRFPQKIGGKFNVTLVVAAVQKLDAIIAARLGRCDWSTPN